MEEPGRCNYRTGTAQVGTVQERQMGQLSYLSTISPQPRQTVPTHSTSLPAGLRILNTVMKA